MSLNALRRALEPAIRRVMHLYWRLSRPMTLGARAAVFDAQGHVFLIRHSYVDGWHLPGGGVEAGESMVGALARELMEEGHIALTAPPALHGIFFNGHVSRRDHVALYVVRDFEQVSPPVPNREIVAHGFFALDALPPDTTRATRARLAEILSGAPAAERW
ncbi:NUDIX domain-containing protein [Pseudorhodoplanes sp.]|uniref:NUDIX domain-containing protein n=1 Tax=Pseudorhodoplanes sp. TaxID=1934341 RepID=UPI002BC510DB|nr:NUDIX domain-containing protein [Pseudorhodoplanes sp.]HWV55362.1 NUDIX domain-containing protein [Pseudorhodoplanes sp.]